MMLNIQTLDGSGLVSDAHGIIGNGRAMRSVMEEIAMVAPTTPRF